MTGANSGKPTKPAHLSSNLTFRSDEADILWNEALVHGLPPLIAIVVELAPAVATRLQDLPKYNVDDL